MNACKNNVVKPKVSVIVPIYNVEAYLGRCLDSLVNQTLEEIEIICINDCSLDNSLVMLNKYAKKDKRIKIIDFEKNQGVSIARNAGIKIAQGEYIGTVDPDDYVDLNYYEKLYLKAKETDSDIVHANLKLKELRNVKEYINQVKRIGKIYFLVSHCLSIYKVDFMRKHSLEYPAKIKQNEDIVFLAKALFFANKVEFAKDVFYHYIARENSASKCIEKYSHKYNGMLMVFDFINNTIIDREEYDHFFCHFFGHFFGYSTYLFTRIVLKIRYALVQDIVKIYKSRKYPVILKNIPKYITAECLEDAEKLYSKLEKELEKKFLYNKLNQYPEIKINNLQNRKLYIWGAGHDAFTALVQCDNNGWQVEAFLDSNPKTAEFQEYKIINPQEILKADDKNFFIVISSRKYADEIAKICEDAGLKEGLDFWKPIKPKDVLIMDILDVLVTEKCSLKCKKCANLMQYFTKPLHMSLEQVQRDIDLIFSKVDWIHNFYIFGGEAFLYKQLSQVIEYAAKYEKRYSSLRTTTNGTIVPSDSTFQSMKKNEMFVEVSDYGEYSRKINELIEKLELYQIPYHRASIKWFEYQQLVSNEGRNAKEVFSKCKEKCATLRNGLLYRCPFLVHAETLRAIPYSKHNHIDISRADVKKSDIADYMAEPDSHLHPPPGCAYCSGYDVGNMQEVPIAEQVKLPLPYRKY
jgi:glycosyltransferase involved in cell wall biosynthesis